MALRCQVLSADMVPKNFISSEEALVDMLLGKVWMLEAHNKLIRSVNQSFPAPKVVVVHRYISLPAHFYGAAQLNPENLKLRDNYTCQYCGRTGHELKSHEEWSRDHIFPTSRGGEDRWENVVLACNTCNNRKGDLTPDEAGMPLLNEPVRPTRWQLDSLRKLRA